MARNVLVLHADGGVPLHGTPERSLFMKDEREACEITAAAFCLDRDSKGHPTDRTLLPRREVPEEGGIKVFGPEPPNVDHLLKLDFEDGRYRVVAIPPLVRVRSDNQGSRLA